MDLLDAHDDLIASRVRGIQEQYEVLNTLAAQAPMGITSAISPSQPTNDDYNIADAFFSLEQVRHEISDCADGQLELNMKLSNILRGDASNVKSQSLVRSVFSGKNGMGVDSSPALTNSNKRLSAHKKGVENALREREDQKTINLSLACPVFPGYKEDRAGMVGLGGSAVSGRTESGKENVFSTDKQSGNQKSRSRSRSRTTTSNSSDSDSGSRASRYSRTSHATTISTRPSPGGTGNRLMELSRPRRRGDGDSDNKKRKTSRSRSRSRSKTRSLASDSKTKEKKPKTHGIAFGTTMKQSALKTRVAAKKADRIGGEAQKLVGTVVRAAEISALAAEREIREGRAELRKKQEEVHRLKEEVDRFKEIQGAETGAIVGLDGGVQGFADEADDASIAVYKVMTASVPAIGNDQVKIVVSDDDRDPEDDHESLPVKRSSYNSPNPVMISNDMPVDEEIVGEEEKREEKGIATQLAAPVVAKSFEWVKPSPVCATLISNEGEEQVSDEQHGGGRQTMSLVKSVSPQRLSQSAFHPVKLQEEEGTNGDDNETNNINNFTPPPDINELLLKLVAASGGETVAPAPAPAVTTIVAPEPSHDDKFNRTIALLEKTAETQRLTAERETRLAEREEGIVSLERSIREALRAPYRVPFLAGEREVKEEKQEKSKKEKTVYKVSGQKETTNPNSGSIQSLSGNSYTGVKNSVPAKSSSSKSTKSKILGSSSAWNSVAPGASFELASSNRDVEAFDKGGPQVSEGTLVFPGVAPSGVEERMVWRRGAVEGLEGATGVEGLVEVVDIRSGSILIDFKIDTRQKEGFDSSVLMSKIVEAVTAGKLEVNGIKCLGLRDVNGLEAKAFRTNFCRLLKGGEEFKSLGMRKCVDPSGRMTATQGGWVYNESDGDGKSESEEEMLGEPKKAFEFGGDGTPLKTPVRSRGSGSERPTGGEDLTKGVGESVEALNLSVVKEEEGEEDNTKEDEKAKEDEIIEKKKKGPKSEEDAKSIEDPKENEERKSPPVLQIPKQQKFETNFGRMLKAGDDFQKQKLAKKPLSPVKIIASDSGGSTDNPANTASGAEPEYKVARKAIADAEKAEKELEEQLAAARAEIRQEEQRKLKEKLEEQENRMKTEIKHDIEIEKAKSDKRLRLLEEQLSDTQKQLQQQIKNNLKPPKLISVGLEFPDADISMTTTETSDSSDLNDSNGSMESDDFGIGFAIKNEFEERVLPHQAWLERTKQYLGYPTTLNSTTAAVTKEGSDKRRVESGIADRDEWYGKVADSISIARRNMGAREGKNSTNTEDNHLKFLDRVKAMTDSTYERKFSEYEPQFQKPNDDDYEENDVSEEPPHINFLKKAGNLLHEDLSLVASTSSVNTHTAANFSPHTSYGGNNTSISVSMSRSMMTKDTDTSVDTASTKSSQFVKGRGPPKSYFDSRVKSSINLSKSIDLKHSGRNLGRGKRAEQGSFARLYESATSLSSDDSSDTSDGEDEGEMKRLGIPLF
mgnify:FL=1